MGAENIKTNPENKSNTYFLKIADFTIKLFFENTNKDDIILLPSLSNFIYTDKIENEVLFNLSVVCKQTDKIASKISIGTFDTGNGDIIVNKLTDEKYEFFLYDVNHNLCCKLFSNKTFSKCSCQLEGDIYMRRFGLNNALMLIFAFACSLKGGLLIHASAIRENDFGYAFIAKSGTGKSTHTGMWIKAIPKCELLNDDNPIIRIINDIPYLYGSPWSGKTPCYRNIRTKLGSIIRIERSEHNFLEKLKPTEAFASILPCCSTMKWDESIYNAVCNNIIHIIRKLNIYTLHCLPDKNAAILCHEQISDK